MDDEHSKDERRERRLRRLATRHPVCSICGETDDRCLERHHLAGRAYDDETVILCRNCHRRLSDDQEDHPMLDDEEEDEFLFGLGRFLRGLADFFRLLADRLEAFSADLFERARTSGSGP